MSLNARRTQLDTKRSSSFHNHPTNLILIHFVTLPIIQNLICREIYTLILMNAFPLCQYASQNILTLLRHIKKHYQRAAQERIAHIFQKSIQAHRLALSGALSPPHRVSQMRGVPLN